MKGRERYDQKREEGGENQEQKGVRERWKKQGRDCVTTTGDKESDLRVCGGQNGEMATC